MSATESSRQAAEHAEQAVYELDRAIDLIGQVISWLAGTRVKSVDQAANHLYHVAEVVDSSTAREIAVAFTDLGRKIDQTDQEGLLQARDHLNSMVGELRSQADRARQLAQQLGR